MLRIRLQRHGRKKKAFYHVVVAESSNRVKGRIVTKLGIYDPLVKPWGFEVDTAQVDEWIKKGAQPTNTVARLLKSAGHQGVDRFITEMVSRKAKNAPEEPEEAPQESKSEESAEDSPSEEGKSEE